MSNIVARRIELCKACDRLTSFNICKECGCFMPVKTRIKSAECPIGKWSKAPEVLIEEIPQMVNALRNSPPRSADE